ncbi:hypothetical protein CsSME_00035869 [Camellia sinensis var. sinensis]
MMFLLLLRTISKVELLWKLGPSFELWFLMLPRLNTLWICL